MAGKEGRGFAGMDPEKQREIASKGGRAAHAKGTAHEFTSDEAREAGRKGGQAVSQDRGHMSEIGREGGLSSRGGHGRARNVENPGEHSDRERREQSERSAGERSDQGERSDRGEREIGPETAA